MVKVNVEETLEPIDVSIDVEITVANYREIVNENAGSLAGLFSRFGGVQKKVDEEIRKQTIAGVKKGLDERLRDEVLAGIRESVKTAVGGDLERQLKERNVDGNFSVSVDAR